MLNPCEKDIHPQRPYINKYWPAIEQLASENWDNPQILQLLVVELLFRKRPRALLLRNRLIERLITLSENEYFKWPTTEAPEGFSQIENANEWHPQGMLSYVGYKVGISGLDEALRHHTLRTIFTQRIPNLVSLQYMQEWGEPNSGKRLKKLAESIAAFTRNAKRNDKASYQSSIEQWEQDLNYLKNEFYIGKYDRSFDWPKTSI